MRKIWYVLLLMFGFCISVISPDFGMLIIMATVIYALYRFSKSRVDSYVEKDREGAKSSMYKFVFAIILLFMLIFVPVLALLILAIYIAMILVKGVSRE